MNVLITGTSSGIGRATAEKFLSEGHEVYGLDLLPSSISHPRYHHFIADIRKKETLPELPPVEILVNNAGVQDSVDDLATNLVGTMQVTEKYLSEKIRSVLFNASSSAHTGFEFAAYSASKAGVIGYMKNVAWRVSRYGATCNSLSFGGVLTPLNSPVTEDKEAWSEIMKVTPLKKWATPEEAAEWIYFLTVVNRSCTGQDILVDNGEKDCNCTFVWPGF